MYMLDYFKYLRLASADNAKSQTKNFVQHLWLAFCKI